MRATGTREDRVGFVKLQAKYVVQVICGVETESHALREFRRAMRKPSKFLKSRVITQAANTVLLLRTL
jgi:hypothetical protein